jgi:hypothetical protein
MNNKMKKLIKIEKNKLKSEQKSEEKLSKKSLKLNFQKGTTKSAWTTSEKDQ